MTPRTLRIIGGVAALAGLAGVAAGAAVDLTHAAAAYLVAWVTVMTVVLGSLLFVLVHHVTDAGWSTVVRRQAEHVLAALPVLAVLFAPVLLLAPKVYKWANPKYVAGDALYEHKAVFLNVPFFVGRSVAYLVLWVLLAWALRRWSFAGDGGEAKPQAWAAAKRARKWSTVAVIVFALTLSFASFDWLMSLDFHWYSTIFGVYVFAGAAAAGHALLALIVLARRRRTLAGFVADSHVHDVGKWLFAYCCFWGYIAFSQYLLIYYANIPEETIWYLHRWEGPWRAAAVVMCVGLFALPFVVLMPAAAKRSGLVLGPVSVVVLAAQWVQMMWVVYPSTKVEWAVGGAWIDAAALLLLGGAAAAAVAHSMATRDAVPRHDPRLHEVLAAVGAERHEADLASDVEHLHGHAAEGH